ncbi:MarR family winged helix-turn-helix transcriptional regulator [Arthrobacter psychrolactophilus]
MTDVKHEVSAGHGPNIADLLADSIEIIRASLKAASTPTLRGSHYRVMSLIPPEGLRLNELAERAAITKAGIGQFMSYLQDQGYVSLTADTADKRAKIARLTPDGRAAVEHSLQLIADTEARWSKALGPERYLELRRALADITESSRNATD